MTNFRDWCTLVFGSIANFFILLWTYACAEVTETTTGPIINPVVHLVQEEGNEEEEKEETKVHEEYEIEPEPIITCTSPLLQDEAPIRSYSTTGYYY